MHFIHLSLLLTLKTQVHLHLKHFTHTRFIDMPRGQSDGSTFPGEVPSSQMTLASVKLDGKTGAQDTLFLYLPDLLGDHSVTERKTRGTQANSQRTQRQGILGKRQRMRFNSDCSSQPPSPGPGPPTRETQAVHPPHRCIALH